MSGFRSATRRRAEGGGTAGSSGGGCGGREAQSHLPGLPELRADLERLASDPALDDEVNFACRARALDRIEFPLMDRIEVLLGSDGPREELLALKQLADGTRSRLEAIDASLFGRLRGAIRAGQCRGEELRRLIESYARGGTPDRVPRARDGYDTLDAFVNGLLLTGSLPEETRVLETEMVYYQQTPVRIILELVEQASFRPADVLYDLGSGLGHVAILANLLGGVRVTGIEFEPAYCGYARRCAAELGLSEVEFRNEDARNADLAGGSVFFMYSPFRGEMLRAVLRRLVRVAEERTIRIFTYGPCTPRVAMQQWLAPIGSRADQVDRLIGFEST